MTDANSSDDELLRAARGGETEAFLALFRRHRAKPWAVHRSVHAVSELFARLHAQLGRWDLRESFAAALDRELRAAVRKAAVDAAAPDESAWDSCEADLRSAIGAAPLYLPAWWRLERWARTRRGTWIAGAAAAAVVLGACVYGGWPMFATTPLPPFASTVVPLEALTPSPVAIGMGVGIDLPGAPRTVSGSGAAAEPRLWAQIPGPSAGLACLFRVRLTETTELRASITDSRGETRRIVAEGRHGAGEYSLEWDGRDTAGRRVPTGTYRLQVTTDGWGEQRPVVVGR